MNFADVDNKAEWTKAANSMIRWVKGESTKPMRMADNEPFFIQGGQVVQLRGEVYSLIDYGIKQGIIKNL